MVRILVKLLITGILLGLIFVAAVVFIGGAILSKLSTSMGGIVSVVAAIGAALSLWGLLRTWRDLPSWINAGFNRRRDAAAFAALSLAPPLDDGFEDWLARRTRLPADLPAARMRELRVEFRESP
jgi:hypothetical protein